MCDFVIFLNSLLNVLKLLIYFLGLPAFFKNVLKNQEAQEGNSISLQCELSKPGVHVEWWRGREMLRTGERYQLRKKDRTAELLIRKAHPEDSGVYRCICGEQSTEAHVKVNGRHDFLLIISTYHHNT